MKIIFRVDSSNQIGTGHMIRCVTLAKKLEYKGAKCTFICKEHEGSLLDYVVENGFKLKIIKKQKSSHINSEFKENLSHSTWLGSSQLEDAEQTIRLLEDENPDWLVIDHYGIDHRWQESLRPYCKKIFVIDDLADRKHDCDLLLDQNLVDNYLNRYENLVAPQVPKLLGPKFALLQEEYSEFKKRVFPRRHVYKTILVYFGGSDLYGLTESVVDSLIKIVDETVNIDVVSNLPSSSLIDKISRSKNLYIHSRLQSLAPLMAKADLAIGAGGATTWERCFMGLPSIVVATANNQVATSKELHRQGMIYWLGHAKDINKEKLSNELRKIFSDSIFFTTSSKKCMNILDGQGADKVTQIMLLDESVELTARSVTLTDEKFLLDLRNEPEVCSNSLSSEIVNSKSHNLWFEKIIRSPELHRLFIIETLGGLPIGQVSFDLENNTWIMSFSLANFARGKKLSKKMLKLALAEFYRDNPNRAVVARVKLTNQPSQRMLNDLGFNVSESDGGGMSIGICSNLESWFFESILDLIITWLAQGYSVYFSESHLDIPHVDVALYLSYEKLIDKATLKRHQFNAVVHSSKLPEGKGWSPLTWQILEGKNRVVNTLFEVNEGVDSGAILDKNYVEYEGFELLDEIRDKQAKAIVKLCLKLIKNLPQMMENKKSQIGKESFYRRRVPDDSRLDPEKSITEQFNLLRVVDNERYPAFFHHKGHKYIIKIFRDS